VDGDSRGAGGDGKSRKIIVEAMRRPLRRQPDIMHNHSWLSHLTRASPQIHLLNTRFIPG
jgi:hypothetical protein